METPHIPICCNLFFPLLHTQFFSCRVALHVWRVGVMKRRFWLYLVNIFSFITLWVTLKQNWCLYVFITSSDAYSSLDILTLRGKATVSCRESKTRGGNGSQRSAQLPIKRNYINTTMVTWTLKSPSTESRNRVKSALRINCSWENGVVKTLFKFNPSWVTNRAIVPIVGWSLAISMCNP